MPLLQKQNKKKMSVIITKALKIKNSYNGCGIFLNIFYCDNLKMYNQIGCLSYFNLNHIKPI